MLLFFFLLIAAFLLRFRQFLYGMIGIDARAAAAVEDAVLRHASALFAKGGALFRVFGVVLGHQVTPSD